MSITHTPKLDDGVTSFAASPFTHMLRVYAHYIQNLFKQPNQFDFNFSEDQEQTDIIIRMGNSINAEVLERKPAVLIHRSAFVFPQQTHADMQSRNLKTGEIVREAILSGSAFFTVITRAEDVADDLAWFIVEHIWLLKDIEGGEIFFGSANFNITPPSPPQGLVQGDMTDLVAVQVSFPVRMLKKSSVAPLTQRAMNALALTLRDSATQDTLVSIELTKE